MQDVKKKYLAEAGQKLVREKNYRAEKFDFFQRLL